MRANYRRFTSNSEDSGDVENLQTGAYTESMDLVLKTESSDLTLWSVAIDDSPSPTQAWAQEKLC